MEIPANFTRLSEEERSALYFGGTAEEQAEMRRKYEAGLEEERQLAQIAFQNEVIQTD